MDLTDQRLTDQQRAAANHPGPRTLVVGDFGTGKTATLVARYRRLAREHAPERLLVVCHDRAAAQRFGQASLDALQRGLDSLPITTVHGLAHSLLSATGSPVRLLTAAEQRVRVRKALESQRLADWPVLGHLLHRPAFVREVVAALPEVLAAGHDAAEAAGGAWAELGRFARRYIGGLEEAGEADSAMLLARAGSVAAGERSRFDHVLVDDADRLSPLGRRLLAELVDEQVGWTVAGHDRASLLPGAPVFVELDRRFRTDPPGKLVRCAHPSIEPEAIAGELLDAHRRGVTWSEMAVLVRRLGRPARAIGRALARHGIPAVPVPALAAEEPVVTAVLDLLRWVEGSAGEEALDRLLVSPLARLDAVTVRSIRRQAASTGASPEDDPRLADLVDLRNQLQAEAASGSSAADLVYDAWARAFSDLAGNGRGSALGAMDDRALDALVALADGLRRFADRNPGAGLGETLAVVDEGELAPDPWRVASSIGAEGVTITSIEGSAGREWDTVVVAGCVEGELPRPRRGAPLFDPARLAGAETAAEAHRRQALAEERRLFALATSRACSTLLATAAPQPGVLLSRFVEGWPEEPVRLPLAPGQRPPARPVTVSTTAVAPERRLQLSATQLDTYDDCPLRYAYQYVLRARDEPGVHAGLGSLVHEALARFLDPEASMPRTFESLMAVASDLWQDDVARYRPQVEEARRDFVAMLTSWWEHEGSREDLGPEVLAVERRFQFQLGPHSLTGAIDRIDRADDGAGIRVVDYKTGKREPSAADVSEDLQLAVYHLAASRDPELAALGPPTQLQLRYLRTMRTYEQPVTEGLAAGTEQRVLAAAERILAEDFSPSVHANCRTCSFHRLCPLWPEGRQVEAP